MHDTNWHKTKRHFSFVLFLFFLSFLIKSFICKKKLNFFFVLIPSLFYFSLELLRLKYFFTNFFQTFFFLTLSLLVSVNKFFSFLFQSSSLCFTMFCFNRHCKKIFCFRRPLCLDHLCKTTVHITASK